MKKSLIISAILALSACDKDNTDYILNKTAFCSGFGTNETVIICRNTQKISEYAKNLTGRIGVYFDNGKKSAEFVVKNGYADGEFKTYYETGELQQVATMKNGKQDGIVRNYYKNGQTLRETNYIDGKIDGVSRLYTSFGVLMAEFNFKDDNVIDKKTRPILEIINECKKRLNVCNERNATIGCREYLSSKITEINKKGVFVGKDAFVYTKKKYVTGDYIDNKHYYEYIDTVERTIPFFGGTTRVRAYKETDLNAVCNARTIKEDMNIVKHN